MNKIVIANWKMKLSPYEAKRLAERYKTIKPNSGVEVVVCPDFAMLSQVKDLLGKSDLLLGAQSVSAFEKGAYTGDVSAETLKGVGCQYVIVGHSERRMFMGEADEVVNKKLNQVYNENLLPILCIGETLEENKAGQRDSVLVKQLQHALQKVDRLPENELVIAYEPVWAIGSGQYMEASDMQAIQRVVKRAVSGLYSEKFYDQKVRLIYGGSVNSINAADFLTQDNLDGFLVATASLDANDFYEIVRQVK